MYLYGKNPVLVRIKVAPQSIEEIFFTSRFNIKTLSPELKKYSISQKLVSEKFLRKITAGRNHQGICAKVKSFFYSSLEEFFLKNDLDYSLIFLPSVFDPVNSGSLIRTTACLGKFAIILRKRKTTPLSASCLKVASGGENYTPLIRTSSIVGALKRAREEGYFLIGASTRGGKDIRGVRIKFPVGLILGSEASDAKDLLRRFSDIIVSIPMSGAALSFPEDRTKSDNLAVAGAILSYEIFRQRLN